MIPSLPGYIAKRIDFDNFLFQQLKDYNNISVFENCRIENISYTDNGITAISNEITFNAKIIIGADGVNSVVTQKLKHSISKLDTQNLNKCLGLRAYYKNVTGFNNDNFIELFFFRDILPGYFWLFPLPDNTANVGIGMLSSHVKKRKINLKKTMLDIILNNPVISSRFRNALMVEDVKAYSLPLCTKKISISGDRFLLLGDAASLIDPFTGEGIGNAMLSGRIAADIIKQAFGKNDFSPLMLQNYDKILYDKIWNEIKISKILQKLSNYPYLFNLVINKASKNKSLHDTIIKMINNIDVKKQLTRPSFYFNLLFK